MQRILRAKRTNLHEKYDYPKKIIAAQKKEIAQFDQWLAKHK